MNAEEEEAPPFKSPSPPLRQPSDYDSPPHLSTNAGDLEAVIAAESTGATTTMDNKGEIAVLDDVAVAEGGEMQLIDAEIVVEVTGNEGTDVDLEPAKVEEEEANLIIGVEKPIASNFIVEEDGVGEQQLEEVEREQQQKDHNLMGEEEEDVGEKQQEEEVELVEEDHEQEQDHNLMGEDEGDVGEQQQEEVEQEQEQEEEEDEGEEEHERGEEEEEEDEGEEQEREEEEQEEEAGADGDIGLEENREAGEEMEVAEEQSGSVSGGKRKRGSGVKNSKASGKVPSKKNMEDDVCFICFDGGGLVLCDRR